MCFAPGMRAKKVNPGLLPFQGLTYELANALQLILQADASIMGWGHK